MAAVFEAGSPIVTVTQLKSNGGSDYQVGVDLKMIIHWKSPANSKKEDRKRKIAQQDMDYKAQLFAHEIVLKIN